jgi:hypothetical protein
MLAAVIFKNFVANRGGVSFDHLDGLFIAYQSSLDYIMS